MTPRASLIHTSEGDFSIGSAIVHSLEHLCTGADADFSAILYEYSLMLILFDLKTRL